jgi:hypothetical protein
MRMTIDIESKSELEKLSALFKTFNTVTVVSSDEPTMPVIKGDKKIDPKSLFSIWAKTPKSLEDIRKTGWQRN